MKILNKIINALNSLIFAKYCTICKKHVLTSNTTCHHCWNEIVFITGKVCKACGRPHNLSFQYQYYCNSTCLRHGKIFKTIRAACIYNDAIAKIIHQFKYEDKTQHIAVLEKFLITATNPLDYNEIDLVIPIPLSSSRLKERGYNQSALLAARVARFLNKKCKYDILERIKDTPKQMMLSQKLRYKNVKRAFVTAKNIGDELKDLNILLVDDVMTTGATMRECAKALRAAGAKSISAIAIART